MINMLSIVIPCYNEAGNISLLMKSFQDVVLANPDTEVIFVNNGSKDDSKNVFSNELKKYPSSPFHVVTVSQNQGYGYGILQGLLSAKGDVLAWTHADMQTDPMDVVTAYKLYDQSNDPMLFVKGKRMNRKWSDAFFTKGMELYASVILRTRFNDINAQPKLFSRIFFEQVQKNAPFDFSLDLYFLYHAAKKGRIIDFPVYFKDRLYGEAKGGGSLKLKWKLTGRTIKYIMKLRKEL